MPIVQQPQKWLSTEAFLGNFSFFELSNYKSKHKTTITSPTFKLFKFWLNYLNKYFYYIYSSRNHKLICYEKFIQGIFSGSYISCSVM